MESYIDTDMMSWDKAQLPQMAMLHGKVAFMPHPEDVVKGHASSQSTSLIALLRETTVLD